MLSQQSRPKPLNRYFQLFIMVQLWSTSFSHTHYRNYQSQSAFSGMEKVLKSQISRTRYLNDIFWLSFRSFSWFLWGYYYFYKDLFLRYGSLDIFDDSYQRLFLPRHYYFGMNLLLTRFMPKKSNRICWCLTENPNSRKIFGLP